MGKKGAARAGRYTGGTTACMVIAKDAEGKPVIDEHEAVVVCNGCSTCTPIHG